MASILDRPRLVTEGATPDDGVPDMTVISEIDEYGINTNLRVRYDHDRIYTYSGTILVAVNPYKKLKIYETDTIEKYRGTKMADKPPHVFATAEASLRYLKNEQKNQSCIISGESGSGKTETTKFILQYLCAVTFSESRWAEQQILEANTILEAFGNAKTLRNDNSSRFGKFIQVCFDSRGQINGCIIQDYLLELSRISFQAKGERNYHVFYQMVSAATSNADLRKDYLLESAKHFVYLNQSGCYELDDVDDREMYEKLCLALQVLEISPHLVTGLFQVLSGILWIGNLEFEDTDNETCRLKSKDKMTCKHISTLLGISQTTMEKLSTTRQITVRGSVTDITLKYHEAKENRHAMAKALYSRVFAWLVSQINSCNNPGKENSRFIGVLDIFGFEKFEKNSFEQMCINYTNEKLHKFFNHYVFALEQQVYKEEGIKYSHISFTDNTLCLELIEKAPKCVLRLLDEECRFPKGTDQSFLEKLHHEIVSHPHFIKGADKRKWQTEFGIKHYAGPVVYTVNGFLDKNKDVQQDMFFDAMETSHSPFVKELTNFRDMLSVYLEKAKSVATKSKNLISGTKTMKGKPTIGDTFRTQLLALVDTLDATTPWYVRCLKPNTQKAARSYDDDLVIQQLQYSGMMDIVRIRREGYPVHVRAREFLEKYRCLAQDDPKPLPSDDKMAVMYILRSLNIPETEWQIGKTKVFLRHTVFEPLEEKRRALLGLKIVIIQKVWRGYRQRKKYLELRRSAIVIQTAFKGLRLRLLFLKKRRAAIVIQKHVRAMFARIYVQKLRIKKREEEARLLRLRMEEEERQRKMLRLKMEEEEQQRKEAERKKEEMEEKSRVEAYEAAQKELILLAEMANRQAEKTIVKKEKGQVDLDDMFTFLAEPPKPKGNEEKEFLDTLAGDLEMMFKTSDGARQPMKKPKQPGAKHVSIAPDTDSHSFVNVGKDGHNRTSRDLRRQRRVRKKLLGFDDTGAEDDYVDPLSYPLIKFAESHFNDFPKETGAFSTMSLRRLPKSINNAITKEEMLAYTKSSVLPTSMIHMHDPENVNLACSIFKDLCKFLRGDARADHVHLIIQSTIAYGIDRPELRDEIFCQLIRQVTDNPREEAIIRGWQFLTLCVTAFPPSKKFNRYLRAYLNGMRIDPIIGGHARKCLDCLKQMKATSRRLPPSSIEIEASKGPSQLICRFYFLDGKSKALGVEPFATSGDVIQLLAVKIDLQDTDGWGLYEVNPEREHFIKGHEYITDILSQWERDQRSSMKMTPYTTLSRKPSFSAALGGGDSKFVFRKRVFLNPKEIPDDPVEYDLMYAQAVHSVVKLDEFPVNEKVALQLAGLHAQVLWGDYDSKLKSRYNDLEQYLHPRLMGETKNRSDDEWKNEIGKAHNLYGSGKTDIQAKVWYLTAVKYYPQYGYTLFPVCYKGFWSHPNNIFIAVGVDGIKFVSRKTKQVLAEHNYSELENIAVDIVEEEFTLNMKTSKPDDNRSIIFESMPGEKEEIANLMASYSPAHQNWQKVGEAPVTMFKSGEEEKSRIWSDIYDSRKHLVEQGILRRPEDRTSGFLTTTLRRYVNRARMDQLAQSSLEKDYDKIFKRSYWSYSKSMLRQPMTISVGDEEDEESLKLFYSIQLHAGITPSSGQGFDDVHPDDVVTLVQVAIQKCIEKEALCNEFYLQLIKQTTEQPDSNGRINSQNWRFLSLICSVIVPRNKTILSYLQVHLRRCGMDSLSDEGKYAQFCNQCMMRTIEAKNRKYPPSQREVHCIIRRRPIHERFYFMDGQFRALEFNSSATTDEALRMIIERIGLRKSCKGFSLYEVFGSLERNMLSNEKVADAIFKWEKYAKSMNSSKQLKLTFKKRLYLKPFYSPDDKVEFNLLLHQAIDDIVNDRFPLSMSEAIYLACLRAQALIGNCHDDIEASDYIAIIEGLIPKHLRHRIQPDEIARKHSEYTDLSADDCNEAFMAFVQQWPLYGATVFEVIQAYTTTLPKNLWLAVNEIGIHILKRRDKEPLVTYEYKSIVNYSPSLKNLMIVTESVTRGAKFVFNTSQASQIAHLIRDYTHQLVEQQRKSQRLSASSSDNDYTMI